MVSYSSIFPISSGGGGSIAGFEWTEKTADFTAEANKAYYCDTALGDVLMTLPSNPAPGDEVAFLLIGANKLNITTTDKIKGSALATDYVKQTGQQYLLFVLFYVDATTGWNWDARYDSYIGNAYIGAGDPHFNNVVLFLRGEGSNNSTSIVDSSITPKTIQVFGGAKISTTTSKYFGSSIYLDGAGDYLKLTENITLSTVFTIEAWVNKTTESQGHDILCSATSGAGNVEWLTYGNRLRTGTPGLSFDNWGNTSIPLSQWAHVATTRNENNILNHWVNGVLDSGGQSSYTNSNLAACFIGRARDGFREFSGYLQCLRITNGVRRYTANFNPETDTFLNL